MTDLKIPETMKAAIFTGPSTPGHFVEIEEIPIPKISSGEILIRVIACGVCRTDLHIVEGDLPRLRPRLIPGHQIVGEIVAGATKDLPLGTRVGVSWMGGVDGDCWYCKHNMENLCDHPTFTGYTVDGGYAQFAAVRADFAIPLPPGLDATHAAPLLCAGIIGFSATLAVPVLQSLNCEVYVVTRGQSHRDSAASLGATWVGKEDDRPPVELDRAITFAPSGKVVIDALSSLRKGGVVAINAIHLDHMPAFDYDKLLWGERQIRSVANMTRADARDFLSIAHQLKIEPRATIFSLQDANQALTAVKDETQNGSAVIVM